MRHSGESRNLLKNDAVYQGIAGSGSPMTKKVKSAMTNKEKTRLTNVKKNLTVISEFSVPLTLIFDI